MVNIDEKEKEKTILEHLFILCELEKTIIQS